MYIIYACLALVLAIQDTRACSCVPMHLHNQVCRATAVFKGRVTSRVSSSTHMYYVHNILIEEVFKDDGSLLEEQQRVQVDTPTQSSMCGLWFNVGNTYFLQVSKTIQDRWATGLCTSTQPWPEDATEGEEFAERLRGMDCNCTVKECHTPFYNPDEVQECLSERLMYDECLYHPYINTEGSPCGLTGRTCQMHLGFCDWTPSLPQDCMLPNVVPKLDDDDEDEDVDEDGNENSLDAEDAPRLDVGEDNGEDEEDGDGEEGEEEEPMVEEPSLEEVEEP